VYIRFGQPDHQSWSDYLVFETDEKVARVKNRLNTIAGEALEEVYRSKHIHGQSQSSYGYGVQSATTEIKGMPTFPIPSRRSVMADGSELGFKWEVWIYAEVAGGIEITFLDPTGKRLYDYAPVPPNSVNYALWVSLAPENVVARVTNRTPSIRWIFICIRQIFGMKRGRGWRFIWECRLTSWAGKNGMVLFMLL
jgi:hypothetical protein